MNLTLLQALLDDPDRSAWLVVADLLDEAGREVEAAAYRLAGARGWDGRSWLWLTADVEGGPHVAVGHVSNVRVDVWLQASRVDIWPQRHPMWTCTTVDGRWCLEVARQTPLSWHDVLSPNLEAGVLAVLRRLLAGLQQRERLRARRHEAAVKGWQTRRARALPTPTG